MPRRNHLHHEHKGAAHRIRNAEPEAKPAPQEPATVVSVIYVTAPKTFDGPIAGYRTMDGSDDASQPQTEDSKDAAPAKATPTAQFEQTADASPTKAQPTKAQETQEQPSESKPISTATPKAKAATESDSAASATPTVSSKIIKSSSQTPLTDSVATKSALTSQSPSQSQSKSQLQSPFAATSSIGQSAATSSASSTPAVAASENSPGMTGGAKAGLAIGILICIGVLLGVMFCCLRRVKRQNRSDDDEKVPMGKSGVGRTLSVQTTRTTATAPRLSLRPVTQFLPDLGTRRKSGNALAAPGGSTHLGPDQATSEKATTSNHVNDPANPFGNHAEVTEKSILPIQSNNPVNPFDNHASAVDEARFKPSSPPPAEAPAPLRIRSPSPEVLNGPGFARVERHNLPNQHNLSPARAASPAMSGRSEFSMTSVSSGYLANGLPPSNVHRVQLDFKPSMNDELGLTAGQLVRLLHEYDDGWALCIRLDRSQQGVAPRTCLSARPVKPRPVANRSAPRGPPPSAMFGSPVPRPTSPASGRGSPGPYSRDPRSMSPVPRPVPRSISPGPYGGGPERPTIPPSGTKRRSNSASQVRERRNSPPGPSPMNPHVNNVQRIPLQLQAVTAPGQLIPQSHTPTGLRKPVPGQAM
ncbi:hypothetical protein MMC07_000365 [Pseudocyphellaria aurata]|nr:hypothetical protein [Pseudocyphellaria aurata]